MKTVFRSLLQVLFRFRACDLDALTGSTGYDTQWRVLWNAGGDGRRLTLRA